MKWEYIMSFRTSPWGNRHRVNPWHCLAVEFVCNQSQSNHAIPVIFLFSSNTTSEAPTSSSSVARVSTIIFNTDRSW